MRTQYLVLLSIASLLAPRVACADESEAASGIAELIIKSATVKCLAEREVDVACEAFHGKVHAVEPEKRVEVEIKDLQFADGQILATYTIASRFGFAGRMTAKDTEHDLKCTADVRVLVELTAKYREESGAYIVDARIADLDKFRMQVVELCRTMCLGEKSRWSSWRRNP